MSKVVIYEEGKIKRAGELIGLLNISGILNIKSLSELINIIESGIPGDYTEPEKGDKKNVMERQKIQSD